MQKQWLLAALFPLLCYSLGSSAADINIDMADGITSQNIPFEMEEKVKVNVSNLAPAKLSRYQFSITYKEPTVPKLTLPNGLAQQIKTYQDAITQGKIKKISPANPDAKVAACNLLKDSFVNLLKTDKETDVKSKMDALDATVDANQGNLDGCVIVDSSGESWKDSVAKLQKSTAKEFTVEIRENLGATFIVSDGNEDGVKKVIEVNTEAKSKWITTFGLGFYENKDQSYFTKPSSIPDSPGYILQEQSDRSDLSYTAQVVFTYPFWEYKGFEVGFSAGLGASQDSIQAMIGPGFVFGKNVVFTVGLTAQEVTVLKGQYSVGDNIGDQPLDSTMLTDKTYKSTIMYALTFRF